jgi:hypothetical protein
VRMGVDFEHFGKKQSRNIGVFLIRST